MRKGKGKACVCYQGIRVRGREAAGQFLTSSSSVSFQPPKKQGDFLSNWVGKHPPPPPPPPPISFSRDLLYRTERRQREEASIIINISPLWSEETYAFAPHLCRTENLIFPKIFFKYIYHIIAVCLHKVQKKANKITF